MAGPIATFEIADDADFSGVHRSRYAVTAMADDTVSFTRTRVDEDDRLKKEHTKDVTLKGGLVDSVSVSESLFFNNGADAPPTVQNMGQHKIKTGEDTVCVLRERRGGGGGGLCGRYPWFAQILFLTSTPIAFPSHLRPQVG